MTDGQRKEDTSTTRRIPAQTRFQEDGRAARGRAQGRANLRRAAASRLAQALRFPARMEWRTQELGVAQGTELRSRGQTPRSRSGGSPDLLRGLRRRDSGREL